jgi:GDP-4-dehydro-6-deoxy-D-mannose reductase
VEKYLVTGFSGFVCEHFLRYLEKNEIRAEVVGIDIADPSFDLAKFSFVKCSFEKIDLLDKQQLNALLARFQPVYILHLASFSSVAYSWKHPSESFANNTNIFLNLIETVQTLNIRCRIISVGSSEEYGNVNEADLPLKETANLHPVSPYAVARVSQEMLSKVYVESLGMDIVMTRSFNHIGAGQKDFFVIPSFAKQLIALKNAPAEKRVIATGDTSVVRDFIDVRDVVEAYYLLFKKGKKGEVYNICSGTGTTLNEVIKIMSASLNLEVKQKVDPALVRPNDNRIIIGSNEKIKRDTGWQNKVSLKKSLEDILDHTQQAESRAKNITG